MPMKMGGGREHNDYLMVKTPSRFSKWGAFNYGTPRTTVACCTTLGLDER